MLSKTYISIWHSKYYYYGATNGISLHTATTLFVLRDSSSFMKTCLREKCINWKIDRKIKPSILGYIDKWCMCTIVT